LNAYTKTRNHRKTLRITQKKSTETKSIVNNKIQAWLGPGPGFTFSMVGGRFAHLPPVSYATDQVHFKHEQPQVLLIELHVTIGTIQQTQDAARVL